MNAEQLLEQYERIADAPDATARMRRFVLDLAVRGKLVRQDQNDAPASELLRRIAFEKGRLVKGGEKKKQEPFELASIAAVMFSIPKSWEWVPATYPAFVVSDRENKVQTKDVLESGRFPVVDQGKRFIRGYCNDPTKVIKIQTPLILFGDHTRETKLVDFDFIVGADGVKLLQPVCLFDKYYFMALQWLPLDSRGYGRHFKLLRASYIPLPPLAEQHRIVAKVDELMALCDRLEAARADREAKRDRLAAVSLSRLNATDPETFQADARFTLDALPALSTRPDQIKQLRQTILNMAVRGKLVPQDTKDEPASELLKRIAAEKARLVKEKKIRDKAPQGVINLDDEPFSIPHGWIWCRLATLFYLVTDGAHHTPRYVETGVPFLSVKNVSSGRISFDDVKYISKEQHDDLCRRCHPTNGDILLTKVGTTGIAVPINTERQFSIFVSLALLKFSKQNLSQRYLCHLINSPFVRQQSADNTQGIGNQNLVLKLIDRFVLPIPPLAEQHRIVARVDELMALCDRLEASLTAATDTRKRLLDSLLVEALAPVVERELEAAE